MKFAFISAVLATAASAYQLTTWSKGKTQTALMANSHSLLTPPLNGPGVSDPQSPGLST